MIKKQQVEHIAKLARLGLSSLEIKQYQKELSKILDYMALLEQADVSSTDALTSSADDESSSAADAVS